MINSVKSERGELELQKDPSNRKEYETNYEDDQTLTNRQGHPVTNNQNIRTVGNRGPAMLENYDFIEKISHFDREKVPERIVHARGAVSMAACWETCVKQKS